MEGGACLVSTGRCKADGHIQKATADLQLKLESSAPGGVNPEIELPVER
jgi:hypothetical protein